LVDGRLIAGHWLLLSALFVCRPLPLLRKRGVRPLASFLLALSRFHGFAATGALIRVS